ncbi:MAG TPA: hypothetical protein VFT72_05905 [Opitutaceae bacterium]|nr:hypothetical protein [Opitutaceae bacterium]
MNALANPTTAAMPASPFGVAWSFLYGYSGMPAVDYSPQLKEVGAGFTKVYLFWNQLEPEKGRFDWTALDAFTKQLPSPDAGLVAIFSASQWGAEKPAAMLPPSPAKNLDDYYHFVFEMVKHANGRVRFWQNDAEPNNPIFWAGTKEQFVAQSKVFHKAVKDADPKAVVIIGGYDGLFVPPDVTVINGRKVTPFPQQQAGLEFFDYVLREAKDAFDLFDLRLYGDPYTINARVDYIRGKMKSHGYERPMICTEYGGPNIFEFPENRKYIPLMGTWSQSVTKTDSNGQPTADHQSINKIEKLYLEMNTLAPQTQMFMQGCSPELEAKFQRIQSRSLVMRNLFGLSAGIKSMIYWDLINVFPRRDDLMSLMYGKIGLYKVAGTSIGERTLTADVFSRMAHALQGVRHVERVAVPDQPSLYVFKVERDGEKTGYVAWEYREPFGGEDQPANPHHWACSAKSAEATDVFGKTLPVTISNGELSLQLSLDPVFVSLTR